LTLARNAQKELLTGHTRHIADHLRMAYSDSSLFTVHVSDCRLFLTLIVVHMVVVAMHLRCGRTFNDKFIANLLLSLSVKGLAFVDVMGKSIVSCFFLTHSQ